MNNARRTGGYRPPAIRATGPSTREASPISGGQSRTDTRRRSASQNRNRVDTRRIPRPPELWDTCGSIDPAPRGGMNFLAALLSPEKLHAMKLWAIRALLILLALAQIGDVVTTNMALAGSPGAVRNDPRVVAAYLGEAT